MYGARAKKIYDKLLMMSLSKDTLAEVKRLFKMAKLDPQNEYSYIKRLNLIASIPTDTRKPKPMSLRAASSILNQSHLGMKPVKASIIDYIAVILNEGDNQSVLLLEGPSGVGKTSIAETIAKVLNRPLLSLSNITKTALKGYPPTIEGSEAGDIIKGVTKLKSLFPVILIDEIDKIGDSPKTLSTLLELLDPIQNNNFKDNYLNIGIDLSGAIFICTANDSEKIAAPLMSRLDQISIPAYSVDEKVAIIRNHILPKIQKQLNISYRYFGLSSEAIEAIINGYTSESGVRHLKTLITKIGRKVVKERLEGKKRKRAVSTSEISHYLGAPSHKQDLTISQSGVAMGLLYSESGGEVMFIESSFLTKTGDFRRFVTGQVQDVMRESSSLAMAYISSRFNESDTSAPRGSIHIHIPDGSTPKDGPSAGVAFYASIMSTIKNVILPPIAMTGEISLKGHVLAVGSITGKIEGAYNLKVREFIIPRSCAPDLAALGKKIRSNSKIHLVDTLADVYAVLFDGAQFLI